ncbi:MAG: hypothetical protein JXR77_18645 [Lentisphaeria bacterium]|nr:hypothetical protein [Lentisphaeria bacterium]
MRVGGCGAAFPSPARVRFGSGLLSAAAILFELALIRVFALRFWHAFAHMAIGVSLLGFGAGGVVLAVLRRRGGGGSPSLHRWAWGFAFSVPLAYGLERQVPLDLAALAWTPSRAWGILLLEAILAVPFLCASVALGGALLDRPARVGAHYAANLVGAGIGAALAVCLLEAVSTAGVLATAAAGGGVAGCILAPRLSGRGGLWSGCGLALLCGALAWMPPEDQISPYKTLALARSMPGVRVLHTRHGALGRLDVLEGASLHHAAGLSLQCPAAVPAHRFLTLDGELADALYEWQGIEDWAFLDQTTGAAAYAVAEARVGVPGSVVRPVPPDAEGARVLVIGAGCGSQVGLALYHGAAEVVGLEMNGDVLRLVTGPLSALGGRIYGMPGVEALQAEARGYLAAPGRPFDVIQVPPLHGFGAAGAGLLSAGESYLYTVEGVRAMVRRLDADGLLALTCWARTPPREGIRLFATVVAALRREGLSPERHSVMIRNWATVTVLASRSPLTPADTEAVRRFCGERGFDLCRLPGLRPAEANRYHVLDRPRYFEAAEALLGPQPETFLRSYPFRVEPTTDDSPYFHCFFRWRSVRALTRTLGGQSRAFLDVGYLLLAVAFVQAVFLAVCGVLLPSAVLAFRGRLAAGAGQTALYFGALGAGFMLFEVGALQHLLVYLARPLYAASMAVACLLVSAGIGSLSAGHSRQGPEASARRTGWCVVGCACAGAAFLGPWLSLTVSRPLGWRLAIAAGTVIGPGFLLGRMLPLGLSLLRRRREALVPWAWGVNGFASVVATLGAPLVGIHIGFRGLLLAAGACYALAALGVRHLDGEG